MEWLSVDTWVSIGTGVGGLAVGAITAWAFVKRKLAEMRKAEATEADIGTIDFGKHSVIHENITELRLETDADRCQVGQFHNGGKFLDGSPMKRFSITHESCDGGQMFEFGSLQGVLTSIFWDMVEAVKRDDPMVIMTESLPESSATKTHNRSKSIEAFSVLPIKKNELFVGFIRVEWTDLASLPKNQTEFAFEFRKYRDFVQFELGKKG